MITLGIDISSQPANTAACLIIWSDDGTAVARPPVPACNDAKLNELIEEASVVGIDAPFGWPRTFSEAVREWISEEWTAQVRDELRFRVTDLAASQLGRRHNIPLRPLSVSTDKISLPAMRAMALLRRHGVTDKSGDGRFFEVYPAGTLACWNLPSRGYKKGPEAGEKRRDILDGIRRRFPQMNIPEKYSHDDHALDALVASITARMAKQGVTMVPNESEQEAARSEGWIHLPKPQD